MALDDPHYPAAAPGAPPASAVCPSEADRGRVVDLLASAFAAGRLDGTEHRRRVDLALRAATYPELGALTADLPGGAPPVPVPYGLPGHPRPWYPYRPTPPLDGLAVTSLVLALLAPVVWFLFGLPVLAALVCGHIALPRARRYAPDSRRFAIAALIIGYAELGAAAFIVLMIIVATAGP